MKIACLVLACNNFGHFSHKIMPLVFDNVTVESEVFALLRPSISGIINQKNLIKIITTTSLINLIRISWIAFFCEGKDHTSLFDC